MYSNWFSMLQNDRTKIPRLITCIRSPKLTARIGTAHTSHSDVIELNWSWIRYFTNATRPIWIEIYISRLPRALRFRTQVTDKSEIDFGSTGDEYFPSFSFRAYSAQPHHCTDARKQSVDMRECTANECAHFLLRNNVWNLSRINTPIYIGQKFPPRKYQIIGRIN